MSNFSAPTRKKGSNDEYKEAVWIDNYFGPKKIRCPIPWNGRVPKR